MQKTLVVAVSGGVDSIVLLDYLMKRYPHSKLVVAHFEHGIRKESLDDFRFVKRIANNYNLTFEYAHGHLGGAASEEKARNARYEFLKSIAEKYKTKLVTAHHLDDLVETVIVNIKRGTGWRGLSVFSDEDIYRPFLKYTKIDLIKYANDNNLVWVEDETNISNKYLRNRIRKNLDNFNDEKKLKIYELWKEQTRLRFLIDKEVESCINKQDGRFFSRYFFSQITEEVAIELLKAIVFNKTQKYLTRPQLKNLWILVKTMPAGRKYSLVSDVQISFTKTEFFFC